MPRCPYCEEYCGLSTVDLTLQNGLSVTLVCCAHCGKIIAVLPTS